MCSDFIEIERDEGIDETKRKRKKKSSEFFNIVNRLNQPSIDRKNERDEDKKHTQCLMDADIIQKNNERDEKTHIDNAYQMAAIERGPNEIHPTDNNCRDRNIVAVEISLFLFRCGCEGAYRILHVCSIAKWRSTKRNPDYFKISSTTPTNVASFLFRRVFLHVMWTQKK